MSKKFELIINAILILILIISIFLTIMSRKIFNLVQALEEAKAGDVIRIPDGVYILSKTTEGRASL